MALMWERMDLFSERSQRAIRQYLPRTLRLESLTLPRLIAEREEWVLKSDYGCEGDQVVIGAEAGPDAWEASLRAALRGRWVVQRRFRPLRDRDGANRVEAGPSQKIPPGVAIEFTGVAFRGALGIRKPKQCIAIGSRRQQFGQAIQFFLRGDECQREFDGGRLFGIPLDRDSLQSGQFGLE